MGLLTTKPEILFSVGKDETKVGIMAQLEYKHQIDLFSSFKEHMYVPEVHPITQVGFFEREGEAHILKVCINIMKN